MNPARPEPLRIRLRQKLERMSVFLLRPLVKRRISPHLLTLAGGLLAAASAWPAAQGRFALAGFLFLAGSLLDALDGPLARAQGRPSRFGAVLDAVMDRLGEGALLAGLCIHFAARGEIIWAAVAAASLLLAFLTSYLRAWGERFRLRMAADWFTRPERVAVLSVGLLSGWIRPALVVLLLVAAGTVLARLGRLRRA